MEPWWMRITRLCMQDQTPPPGMTDYENVLNSYMTMMDWWASNYWRWYLPEGHRDGLKPEQRAVAELFWKFDKTKKMGWAIFADPARKVG